MRALLLAAGLGTRLRPLTNYLPKCLVPIHGRPLLDYWLESLLNHGVSEILINTHYLAPLVVEYLNKTEWKRQLKVVHEERLLGTAGTILKNRGYFQQETFLVAHADNLTVFDASQFAAHHANRPAGTDLTMMAFETDVPQSCGIVELDEHDIVRAFHEKVPSPPGNLANAAVYILEPTVIELIESLSKEDVDFSTEVIPRLMGHIFIYRNDSYHRDIGTVTSWAEAHKDFSALPTSEQNAGAWSSTLKSADEKLLPTIAQLLANAR